MSERFNTLAFRDLFDIVKVDYKEREAEWRVFGRTAFCLVDYAEKNLFSGRRNDICCQREIRGTSLGF